MISRRLLWSDDDGRKRFLREDRLLRKAGWQITWVHSAREALEQLRESSFDVMILDQMMPIWPAGSDGHGEHAQLRVWTGCLVLWWLRTGTIPRDYPDHGDLEAKPPWDEPALDANRDMPILIVSAYWDDDVADVMRAIEKLDLYPKPIDIERLTRRLEEVANGDQS